jgi:hypothetical protein
MKVQFALLNCFLFPLHHLPLPGKSEAMVQVLSQAVCQEVQGQLDVNASTDD